jgi:hypothetical protein
MLLTFYRYVVPSGTLVHRVVNSTELSSLMGLWCITLLIFSTDIIIPSRLIGTVYSVEKNIVKVAKSRQG